MLPRRALLTLILLGVGQVLAIGVALTIRWAFSPVPADTLQDVVAIGIPYGLFVGVTGTLAIWAVLGPLSGIIRWPASLGCMALTTLAFTMIIGTAEIGWGEVIIAAAIIGVQYFVTQGPLWWLRLKHGYHLRLPSDSLIASGLGETQFSLKQLLAVTTLTAFCLGISRALIGERLSREGLDFMDWGVLMVCSVVASFDAAIAWLALACAFRSSLGKGLSLGLLILGPLSLLEEQALRLAQGTPPSNEIWILLLLNLTQFAWLTCGLVALRRAGYRLIKAPRS